MSNSSLFIACLLALSQSFSSFGQQQSGSAFNVYGEVKGGFLMAHRSAMAHLVRENSVGFEVGFMKHFQSTDQDDGYRFPAIGANIEWRDFGYDEVLGQALSISQFVVLPLLQKPAFFVDFQYGVGLGYLTKKYNLETNPTNNAIGSHFNAKVAFKVMVTKYINKTSVGLGVELMHFSNGAITFPNLGLNVPSICLQIGFLNTKRLPFSTRLALPEKLVTERQKEPQNWLISGVFSGKQVRANPNLPQRYPIFGLRGTYQKLLKKNWALEGSIDILHNESNLFFYADSDFKRSDVLQIGAYFGASFRLYKSEVVMGLGYYLRDNINTIGRVYNKLGYRYYLTPNWYGLFMIRANAGRADFFEFGIGHRLKWH